METKKYTVYNPSTESYLSTEVTVIDTRLEPLKVLRVMIDGLALNAETGLWLTPFDGIPQVPRLSPFDLLYLDTECRILLGAELLPGSGALPINARATSALVLPYKSLSASMTRAGQQLLIRPADEPVKEAEPPAPAEEASAATDVPGVADISAGATEPKEAIGPAEGIDPAEGTELDSSAEPAPPEVSASIDVPVASSFPISGDSSAFADAPVTEGLAGEANALVPSDIPTSGDLSDIDTQEVAEQERLHAPAVELLGEPASEQLHAPEQEQHHEPEPEPAQEPEEEEPIEAMDAPVTTVEVLPGLLMEVVSDQLGDTAGAEQAAIPWVAEAEMPQTASQAPVEVIPEAAVSTGEPKSEAPQVELASVPELSPEVDAAEQRWNDKFLALIKTADLATPAEAPAAHPEQRAPEQITEAPAAAPPDLPIPRPSTEIGEPLQRLPGRSPTPAPRRPRVPRGSQVGKRSRTKSSVAPTVPVASAETVVPEVPDADFPPLGTVAPGASAVPVATAVPALPEVPVVYAAPVEPAVPPAPALSSTVFAPAAPPAPATPPAPQPASAPAPEAKPDIQGPLEPPLSTAPKEPAIVRFLRWVDPTLVNNPERRLALRRRLPELVAYRVKDGTPRQYRIGNISSTGIYLYMEERWPASELVSLTLQVKGPPEPDPERRAVVRAKAVRWGENGIGFRFVLPDGMDLRLWEDESKTSADGRRPEYVVNEIRLAQALAFVSRICPAVAKGVEQLFEKEFSSYRSANAVEIAIQAEGLLAMEKDADRWRAHPAAVLRILEAGSWAEFEFVRVFWAGLLATACTAEGNDESNLSLMDILTLLTAMHLRILMAACANAANVTSEPGTVSSAPLYFTPDEIGRITGSADRTKIDRAVSLLGEVGLIETTPRSHFYSATDPIKATPTRLGLHMLARLNGRRAEQ